MWADSDGEVRGYYAIEASFATSVPVTLLLDGEGNLLVYYKRVPVLNPSSATHATDVLADYVSWTKHNP